MLAAAFALAWHPEIEQDHAAGGRLLRPLRSSPRARTSPSSATAPAAIPPSRARPLAGGRALADAVRHGVRHQHHARCRRRASAPGRARPSTARCGAASRATATHLYPAFPYDHFTHATDERARRALCLADDAAARSRAARRRRSSPACSASGRWSPPGTCSTWTRARSRPIRRNRRDWNRGRALAEGLAHCGGCHTPRNRFGAEDKARAYDGAMDRRLVRAAAQRPLAGRAAVDGGPASRLPAHRPQPGARGRRRPDGRRDARAVAGAATRTCAPSPSTSPR